ncbi:MAG TPA: TonB-dependent receptor [Caldimonas sp.]|jgi:iron complex outermembrane receptor protein|nr:TonB-dependent receptor [Caldimonas sp.]HEX2540442.1 TonB-dependent receptor [Caldimonas sp.]
MPCLHLRRRPRRPAGALCALALAAGPAARAAEAPLPAAELGRVEINASRPSTMPAEIPTTVETITGEQVHKSINATDAEDALKYLPSLTVRKRYVGDYDHAVLATRASGTGNSARSLVYADGILLSNLLGNGAAFTPRWGLVTPEEIERVEVLYGPFSAAYSGNSAGAIVDYVTRMPTRLEAHVKAQGFTERFRLYGTDERYSGGAGNASLGSRSGPLAWWINVSRLVSDAQPMNYVVRNLGPPATAGGTPVSGAVPDRNPRNVEGLVLGTTGQTRTLQDHAKVKLAYDLTPMLRASYTLGYWRNDADRDVDSYLRDDAGSVVGSGPAPRAVVIDGRSYTIAPADFARSRAAMEHVMHGLSIQSSTRGEWDWGATASRYDYAHDVVRAQVPNVAAPNAGAGAGRITDQEGTGWWTLAAKGTWRPQSAGGAHVVEFGVQHDAFKLRTTVADTPEWSAGPAAARFSAFTGRTTLTSLWGQHAWRPAPAWRAVLGARVERWRADDGSLANATTTRFFAPRSETSVSPKAALSWQASDAWLLRASTGRAVRNPTVSELFQGSIVANEIVNNDPDLKPEKSWTSELTAERSFVDATLRATLFHERTRDALYSQVNLAAGGTVATIQNVDRVRTTGLELAGQAGHVGLRGLGLAGSVTYADSTITRNDAFPASVGKWQPRVPRWRATLLATYAPNERWSASLGLRYSGRQYGQLDNSDPNGFAFTGFSRFLVADVRVQVRVAPKWRVAFGIDNVNDDRYWAFHPYPQRTYHAELRYDL